MSRGLVLRADADRATGFGHVTRCFALADAWTAGPVVLRSRDLPEALRTIATTRGIRVVHAESVGDEADAAATRSLAEAERAVVVVDSYAIGAPFRSLVGAGAPVCWIDDAGSCDDVAATIVVNGNLDATDAWYPHAGAAQVLAGPRYALLRRSFGETTTRVVAPERARVVMTFGGSDPGGWSWKVLRALERPSDAALLAGAAVEIIIGAGVADADQLVSAATGIGVTTHRNVRDMAELLASASVVVAAAGTTVLELACLGCPAVLVTVADNQLAVARAAHAAGMAWHCTGSATEVFAAVRALLADAPRRAAMRAAGRLLVDGDGVPRVVAALMSA